MKIYTRTGDAGTTSLVGGTRVKKSSVRLEAYGTIDELNSWLGMLVANATALDDAARTTLLSVQNNLFNVGCYLATDSTANAPTPPPAIARATAMLEAEIDRITPQLPQLRAFILPGGCPDAALANVCRTVCRRAERHIAALADEAPVDAEVSAFVNRLSDYLFTLGRQLNLLTNTTEQTWQQ